jgi:hypothetical protein
MGMRGLLFTVFVMKETYCRLEQKFSTVVKSL